MSEQKGGIPVNTLYKHNNPRPGAYRRSTTGDGFMIFVSLVISLLIGIALILRWTYQAIMAGVQYFLELHWAIQGGLILLAILIAAPPIAYFTLRAIGLARGIWFGITHTDQEIEEMLNS